MVRHRVDTARKTTRKIGSQTFQLRSGPLGKRKAQSRCKKLRANYKHCRLQKSARGKYRAYVHGKK